ncbi:MAG: SDR family oxidoreductase, partial [Verrucomicrobiota bacterium]|nr:SDR family oxidoreductase [Verrucomicrobiota bacterium]
SFDGKIVLITGGSRGLGLALARQACARRARVALLARDPNELARACDDLTRLGGDALPVECDLLEPAQIEQAVGRIVDHFGGLDVVINNAGIIEVGPLAHMKRADFEKAMMLHFWAPYHVISEAIPHFRRRGGGRIVNISSIGGKIAVPHMAPYTASKFALAGFSDAIRAELARENIHVTTVTPGMMRTGSQVFAKFKGDHAAEYKRFTASSRLPFASISAERAARKILAACASARPALVMPMSARIMIMANALFPNLFGRMMKMANACLPSPAGPGGDESRGGSEIR